MKFKEVMIFRQIKRKATQKNRSNLKEGNKDNHLDLSIKSKRLGEMEYLESFEVKKIF